MISKENSVKIADKLNSMRRAFPDRWFIRASGQDHGFSAVSENVDCKAFSCPEQTGKVNSCAECGACITARIPVRFLGHADPLAADHRAMVEANSRYQGKLTGLSPVNETVLKPGNGKLGKRANRKTWGSWDGAKVYALTLEERKTCPRSCAHWADCYGNNLHLSRRIAEGPELVAAIMRDLETLTKGNTRRIIVRLHVLGDFYSESYVEAWRMALAMYSKVLVFGYTAHPIDPTM